MDWMIIEKTLEEELYLESTVRQIQACEDLQLLQGMCSALTTQSWHTAKLLSQAVNHIASLDATIISSD